MEFSTLVGVRPGDILGALTGEAGIAGSEVGKINVFDFHTYVAIRRASADLALTRLSANKIKGELNMETEASLLKGGKNGILWDSTAKDLGLLLQRIQLIALRLVIIVC